MKQNLLFLTCALGLSGFFGAQACSSDGSASGGGAGKAGTAGDAGDTGDAGASTTAGSGGSTSHAGTGGEAGELIGTAGAGGDVGEGGAGAGGEGGAAELTQAELCDQFCTGEFITCTAANQQYADEPSCLTACNAFAPGTPGDVAGDTLQCRIYHLNLAMTMPVPHCSHTSANPSAACVD
ncbi:MAG: hypothetical protein ABW061_19440 [Polyangiaceae bacterium]